MRSLRYFLLLVPIGFSSSSFGAEVPPWLPRYDVAINLDVEGHEARVTQHVTWTNRHKRPTNEIIFNVHSRFQPPQGSLDYLFLAKMLEIMRVPASHGIYEQPAFEMDKAKLLRKTSKGLEQEEVKFHYHEQVPTTLIVTLPEAIQEGQSVTIALDFHFHIPQKKGRWGQWNQVTILTNWLPVCAYYDQQGWQPVPFIPWHQPFFNEAGVYDVHVELPEDHHVASTGSIRETKQLDNHRKEVFIGPVVARDFAFLASPRYKEFSGTTTGKVKVRVMAFEEHEHYANEMVKIVCRAIDTYSKWLGPFPYPEFTIAESYFGWNGNECAGLVMIDDRVFGMPNLMEGYADYLLSHETCHQWWYNMVGTDGYRETFMDEAFATHFAHRLLNHFKGKNNELLKLPSGFSWLPNIKRDDYRYSQFYSTLHRGELKQPLQEMQKFGHVVNLFSSVYDRGSLVVGMIEERLGEAAFLEFIRHIQRKYHFRIIRVAEFQRELEEFTGQQWGDFFDRWLRGVGMSDWSVESVKVEKVPSPTANKDTFLNHLQKESKGGLHRTTVILKQKAEHDEPTQLGFSFDDGETYVVRIPVVPEAGRISIPDPPGEVEPLGDHRIKVDILLPSKPSQVAVDPDQILLDSEPANNFWKSRTKYRATPVYTFLDETNLTAAYDRLNVIAGPWLFSPAYIDPWFTRSTVIGARVGVLRVEEFSAGIYAGYRPDFRDVAVGADAQIMNVFPKFDVGVHAEKALFDIGTGGSDLDRAVLYGRYVITKAASLYSAPMHYAEGFASWQRNFLPEPRNPAPGSRRFDTLTQAGLHYHLDYLTPYWDPELGFKLDITYAAGFPILNQNDYTQQGSAQFSWAWTPPERWGWISHTHFAFRGYGAIASPSDGEFFSLGGNLLFRGFDLAERQGSLAWIGSVEWRIPVIRECEYDAVDHVVGLRNLYTVPFYDVGEIYSSKQSVGGVAHALGIGLRADVAWFSFIERTTLRLDIAKTVNAASPFQFWIGVSHPF